ncbi:MAG: hypothetical protein WCF03_01210 [Nitrososphaeraceae archaeon]
MLEDIFVAVDNGVPFCKADDCAHVGSAMAVNNYLVLLVVEERKHETTLLPESTNTIAAIEH